MKLEFGGAGLKRAIDAHSGASAAVVEGAKAAGRQFDALWSGSLATSAQCGLSDDGVIPLHKRLSIVDDIRAGSTLPIFYDAENGGPLDRLPELVCQLEGHGVAAIVIADREEQSNSLAPLQRGELMELKDFKRVLACAVASRKNPDTLIVGRLEGLIFNDAPAEVVRRAMAIESTGIGAILIHSRSKKPQEVCATARRYRSAGGVLPLIAVPSTYSSVKEDQLASAGFSLVVYANQLIRASMHNMQQVANGLLVERRSGPFEHRMFPISSLIALFSGGHRGRDHGSR